jgi:hypothetical protein
MKFSRGELISKLFNNRQLCHVSWYKVSDRHGENWHNFRTRVQQAMLQPRTAKLYVKPIEETAMAFVRRARSLRDSNLEVPEDFLNEIHKWSLECEYELSYSWKETGSPPLLLYVLRYKYVNLELWASSVVKFKQWIKWLTPHIRDFLEKLLVIQLVNKLPNFHRTWRIVSMLTRLHHRSLSWASGIQSTSPHIFTHKNNFNIILPCMPTPLTVVSSLQAL